MKRLGSANPAFLLLVLIGAAVFGYAQQSEKQPQHEEKARPEPQHTQQQSQHSQQQPQHTQQQPQHGQQQPQHTQQQSQHGQQQPQRAQQQPQHTQQQPQHTQQQPQHAQQQPQHTQQQPQHGQQPSQRTQQQPQNQNKQQHAQQEQPSGNHGGNSVSSRGDVGSHTAPARTVPLKGGGSASLRANGQIRSVNQGGMQIQNNLRGGRTVVSEHNGTRVVTTGRGNGYVQSSYVTRGGHSYYSRTYYQNGAYRVGIYRGYNYGGNRYYGYYPGSWYNPGFYGWAYQPWGASVYWGTGMGGWGWGGSPWYGYYGGYFSPYPVYASPAFWLTDYVIAANLQAAYASRSAASSDAGYDQRSANYGDGGGQASNSAPVTLTPEVKRAIAEEVKAQLAADQQQSSGGQAQAVAPANGEVPPALDPARRTFVVDNNITVVSDGQECELTAGDVVTRLTDTPDADQNVTASVSASKRTDCGAGRQITVSVEDLQEMHNHFEEQLNNGMKALAEKQGTGGLPKAPDTATTTSDVPPPSPDKSAAEDLNNQQAAADQAETQVKQETAPGPGGGQ